MTENPYQDSGASPPRVQEIDDSRSKTNEASILRKEPGSLKIPHAPKQPPKVGAVLETCPPTDQYSPDPRVESRGTSELTPCDLAAFARLGIGAELLAKADVRRVTDQEAREVYGVIGPVTMDMSGIVFPYFNPITDKRVTARIRRDHPEIDSSTQRPKAKYVSAYGDRRHLYFVRGGSALMDDPSAVIVLVEAEKSALALTAWALRNQQTVLPIAMGGCYGWRGRIGKRDGADGTRVDEIGPLPELAVCRNRDVVVMLDANADFNAKVRKARFALITALENLGARVSVASIPPGDGVNGPDDLIAVGSDEAMRSVLQLVQPSKELAVAEAESAIREILSAKPDFSAEEMTRALDAVSHVPDQVERRMLEARLAAAVRGLVPKSTVTQEIDVRRRGREAHKQDFARRNREAELRAVAVDRVQLIEELEAFFADRAHLPGGAALVLAYFALNTWTFKVFDTVPYLILESAVPGCGKSTVLRLLHAISCRSRKASSLTEAVMFRLIDDEGPTLLIDEAETIDGRSDRAEALRAVAHEGYKQGGQVPRCEGDSHAVRWFNVFCPKLFAAIGGLNGPLLDRSLVIHMDKAPRGQVRRSTRHKNLERDARQLLEKLEAYALQSADALRQMYDAEPDAGYWPSIGDREGELWGPLLTHARLAGPSAEAKLLAVVDRFSEEKAKIKSEDTKIAQTIALLEVLIQHPDPAFTPGELVDALIKSEVWARTLSDVRTHDEGAMRTCQAAKIGRFLRSFRLESKKNGGGSKTYDRQAAIDCLSAHIPQPPKPPEPPYSETPDVQVAVNKDLAEDAEATEAFARQSVPQNIEDSAASGEQENLSIEIATVAARQPCQSSSDDMLEGVI